MEGGKQRVFKMTYANGRPLTVVVPPESKNSERFADNARKSNWLQDLLGGNNDWVVGILRYLVAHHKDLYQ